MNRPVGRAAQPPSRPPAAPGNGNGGSELPANILDADQIYADGVTAGDDLHAVLGDRYTGNNQADCIMACQQIKADITTWEASILRHRERRARILHLLYNDYSRRTARAQQNNWAWVAGMLREPLATVHKWAHYIECFYSEKTPS